MYSFTRVWGLIAAAFGWIVLVGAPVSFYLAAIVFVRLSAQLAPVMGGPPPWLLQGQNSTIFIVAMTIIGLFAGFVVGGGYIVTGQRLQIEVVSVNIQSAMLEQLEHLSAQADRRPGERAGGRFSGLAAE
jgi:hypothetical protein